MLARSHGARFDHNQENPHSHLHHKTPARPGKSAPTAGPAPVTGGKGILQQTAKSCRVLGAKDRNGGKADQQGESEARYPAALLFPGKPGASTSQAQAGPSCAPRPAQQQFKTPLPNKSRRPAQDLRTPATALRPKHAPPLMLGSPDVSMEEQIEEQQQEPQEEEDTEVEYAGPSARDYDEPYIPDHPESDYTTAGFGAAIKSMSLGRMEDPEDWARQDALERSLFKAELDEGVAEDAALKSLDAPEPLFPAPKRRAPLAAKSANGPLSALSSVSRGRVATALNASSSAGSARKAVLGSSALSRRPLTPAAGLPGSLSRPEKAASAMVRVGPHPPSRLGLQSTKPGLSATTKPAFSGAATRKAPTTVSAASSSTPLATTRPRPPPLSLSRPASSASMRSASSAAPLSPAQAMAKREAEEQAAERELGMFGVVAGGEDLLDIGLGTFQFGDEGGFELDLEL